jgi:hypothetical protein
MKHLFTEIQPKDGDHVVTCSHPKKDPQHFFQLTEVEVLTPDGRKINPAFLILCGECLINYATSPLTAIKGDAIWIGDEPIIEKELVN